MEITKFGSQAPPILTYIQQNFGFAAFVKDDNYDLNIIGVRNPNGTVNAFDDHLYVVCKIKGKWYQHRFACTTDPGLYYLEKPMNVNGTAIMMAPQQMRGVYQIAKHQGKYLALCQRGKVKVWRDRDRDGTHNMEGDLYNGGGVNIHRAGATSKSKRVGKFSAGCQVIQDPADFKAFMELCRMQIKHHPTWTNFTYTLIEADHAIFEK